MGTNYADHKKKRNKNLINTIQHNCYEMLTRVYVRLRKKLQFYSQ